MRDCTGSAPFNVRRVGSGATTVDPQPVETDLNIPHQRLDRETLRRGLRATLKGERQKAYQRSHEDGEATIHTGTPGGSSQSTETLQPRVQENGILFKNLQEITHVDGNLARNRVVCPSRTSS